MVLDGDEWTISGIDKTTGESSVLKIAKHRAGEHLVSGRLYRDGRAMPVGHI